MTQLNVHTTPVLNKQNHVWRASNKMSPNNFRISIVIYGSSTQLKNQNNVKKSPQINPQSPKFILKLN